MKATQEKLEEWKEVEEEREEDSVYLKWEKEGTELVGTLKEMFQSKTGAWFGKIDTGAELLTMFSVPVLLRGKLDGLEGKKVKIAYIGQTKFKSGRLGKDFKVFASEKGATPSSGPEAFMDRGDNL